MSGPPRLLDLFSGAGGAGAGYARAGWRVLGIDNREMPSNPYPTLLGDALSIEPDWIGHNFEAVHASPPCQRFSSMTLANGFAARSRHPDLIERTRDLLDESGLPYVIENVPSAPLRNPITLCGSMFGLRVRRHRRFESNVSIMAPPCGKHEPVWAHNTSRDWAMVTRGEITRDRQDVLWQRWVCPVGHLPNWMVPSHGDAMGIDWMGANDLVQSVPPAYTQHIGLQLLNFV